MSTARAAHDVPYAGLGLDRHPAGDLDASWRAATARLPQTRVWTLWRDRCLVVGDPPRPAAVVDPDPDDLVLLGHGDDGHQFALDLSDLDEAQALELARADRAVDTRALYPQLSASESAALAHARGLTYWHRQQRFCGRCGAPTTARDGGQVRVCTDEGTLLFPRIEPAVIVLVEGHGDTPRCLLARHRASTTGTYSLLAGFVEIGESLEDAVRREMHEEVGVTIDDVSYVASQPWPFPAGIMIAFRARTADEVVHVDGDEIVDARWFTRPELAEHLAARDGTGRTDSVDTVLLQDWLRD